jgi:hypothetical protein
MREVLSFVKIQKEKGEDNKGGVTVLFLLCVIMVLFFTGVQNSGGGEVSGGGTHYM